jgi:hypothetical protein
MASTTPPDPKINIAAPFASINAKVASISSGLTSKNSKVLTAPIRAAKAGQNKGVAAEHGVRPVSAGNAATTGMAGAYSLPN